MPSSALLEPAATQCCGAVAWPAVCWIPLHVHEWLGSWAVACARGAWCWVEYRGLLVPTSTLLVLVCVGNYSDGYDGRCNDHTVIASAVVSVVAVVSAVCEGHTEMCVTGLQALLLSIHCAVHHRSSDVHHGRLPQQCCHCNNAPGCLCLQSMVFTVKGTQHGGGNMKVLTFSVNVKDRVMVISWLYCLNPGAMQCQCQCLSHSFVFFNTQGKFHGTSCGLGYRRVVLLAPCSTTSYPLSHIIPQ